MRDSKEFALANGLDSLIESKERQILEIYFSYGDDTTRLQGDSRHTQDVNLHIITQGYERVKVEVA